MFRTGKEMRISPILPGSRYALMNHLRIGWNQAERGAGWRPDCPASSIPDLEEDLGRQLKLARRAAARRVIADGCGDHPEVNRIGQVSIGRAILGPVEDVEQIRSEADIYLLRDV